MRTDLYKVNPETVANTKPPVGFLQTLQDFTRESIIFARELRGTQQGPGDHTAWNNIANQSHPPLLGQDPGGTSTAIPDNWNGHKSDVFLPCRCSLFGPKRAFILGGFEPVILASFFLLSQQRLVNSPDFHLPNPARNPLCFFAWSIFPGEDAHSSQLGQKLRAQLNLDRAEATLWPLLWG